ncbi:hypothetical protein RRG08_060653 [Elysia crispata]|uniref:Uncharacterized protein n=1 Tax=Elysia crispata TaxID=231223 RepID=A0AAE1E4W0_9GAST|nr:hypothetical protein RRG08_060653 [Elysia crispata]
MYEQEGTVVTSSQGGTEAFGQDPAQYGPLGRNSCYQLSRRDWSVWTGPCTVRPARKEQLLPALKAGLERLDDDDDDGPPRTDNHKTCIIRCHMITRNEQGYEMRTKKKMKTWAYIYGGLGTLWGRRQVGRDPGAGDIFTPGSTID